MEEGLQRGVQEGLQRGVQEGLQRGVQEGLQRGVQEGLQRGVQEGLQRGVQEGLQRGVQEGLQRGMERGVAAIERLFQRRLGRALTAAEHDELLRRVDTLGAERIGDVVLDLATNELAAWLADPAAR
jgi:flagellar biosynthesis/type III secretory pathway protein FliH